MFIVAVIDHEGVLSIWDEGYQTEAAAKEAVKEFAADTFGAYEGDEDATDFDENGDFWLNNNQFKVSEVRLPKNKR